MPIDPNIALQVQSQPLFDPLRAYQQAMTIRGLASQHQLQELQLRKAQQESDDTQAMRGAYAFGEDGSFDEPTTFRNLARINPQAAGKFRHDSAVEKATLAKSQREARSAELDQAVKGYKVLGHLVGQMDPTTSTMDDVLRFDATAKRYGLGGEYSLPQSLEQIPDWHAAILNGSLDAAQRLEASRPMSPQGKVIADHERRQRELTRLGYGSGGETGQPGSVDANGNLVAGAVQVKPPLTGLESTIAGFGGAADATHRYGPDGKVINNQPVQDFQLAKAEKSAPKLNIGINAYEKALNTQDAQAVSDSRKAAEQATGAAQDARAIAQSLKGINGGNWSQWQAVLGGWLPGTSYQNVTSAVGLADAIRARAAPALRVPGSGATSDFESKQLLGIFPQLMQSEAGRDLVANVLERVAERQAIAADIKDEMVRAGRYSVSEYNRRLKQEFGDGLFTPEERKALEAMKAGKPVAAPAPASAPTAASAPQNAQPPKFDLRSMPDPAKHSGKVIESSDGVRYKSDGKKWSKVP